MTEYNYYVARDDGKESVTVYDGKDVAEAMAAWSKLISEGHEYAMLEALEVKPR